MKIFGEWQLKTTHCHKDFSLEAYKVKKTYGRHITTTSKPHDHEPARPIQHGECSRRLAPCRFATIRHLTNLSRPNLSQSRDVRQTKRNARVLQMALDQMTRSDGVKVAGLSSLRLPENKMDAAIFAPTNRDGRENKHRHKWTRRFHVVCCV